MIVPSSAVQKKKAKKRLPQTAEMERRWQASVLAPHRASPQARSQSIVSDGKMKEGCGVLRQQIRESLKPVDLEQGFREIDEFKRHCLFSFADDFFLDLEYVGSLVADVPVGVSVCVCVL